MTSALPTLTVDWSFGEIYRHATPYWDLATGKGSPSATTSFRHEYDINDFKYGDLDGKKRRYVGERGMALGYMTNSVKLTKFMRHELGFQLLGVDCSKPGGVKGRTDRIRGVQSDFVELCARYSKLYQEQVGDLHAVKMERGMVDGEFALRWGFGVAIVSQDFVELKRKWRADEAAEQAAEQAPVVAPVLPATPLAVVVGVQLPEAPVPAPTPALAPGHAPRCPSVVDIDDEEEEEEEETGPEDDTVLQAAADYEAAETAEAAAAAAEAEPLELDPYNERSQVVFVTLIRLLLRSPATAQEAHAELRDLGNTICESNYEMHVRRVRELIGWERANEYMEVLERGREHNASSPGTPAPAPAPTPTPAPAPAPAPVHEEPEEPQRPEGWCPVLHKKIFGDDDDDEEEDEEKDEDDGPGHPVTFREDERLPIPGIPQTYDHVKPEDDAVDAAHEAEPERVHPRKQPALRRIKREAPALAPAPVPAPAPAPAAKKQRVAISATNDHKQFFTDDEWRALGVDILTKYQAAKVTYKTNKYDAENTPILNAQAPLYHIKTQRRADGKSAGQQDTDVHFAPHSPLHKILKKTKFRSVPDIKRAFGLA